MNDAQTLAKAKTLLEQKHHAQAVQTPRRARGKGYGWRFATGVLCKDRPERTFSGRSYRWSRIR